MLPFLDSSGTQGSEGAAWPMCGLGASATTDQAREPANRVQGIQELLNPSQEESDMTLPVCSQDHVKENRGTENSASLPA